MSLIPDFEIGLWNAWIFMILYFLTYVPGFILNKKAMKDLGTTPPYNKTEKRIWTIVKAIYAIAADYTVFLPIKLGTAWFYTGLLICFLGLVMNVIAVVDFSTTPSDKPVTKGVYHISRNPIYLAYILLYVGIAIACVSWILLVLTIIYIILQTILLNDEECFILKKQGQAYCAYMCKTPRWIEIPNLVKKHLTRLSHSRHRITSYDKNLLHPPHCYHRKQV